MSIFQQTLEQSDERFLRDVGISKATFQQLLDKVATYLAVQREKNPMKKRGLKSTIGLADQLLLTLTYLRHYPTFAKLGKEFSISESYANKIYHRMLDILVRVLPMNSKKELLRSNLDSVVIDVTEQPIERPKQQQHQYYSGKKCHTLKVQLIICWVSLQILSVICRKSKVHDFRILKESRLAINRETEKLADGGYQGIDKVYPNSVSPVKRSRNKPLSDAERRFNEALSRRRIVIEHVNRRCKIFRITQQRYRGKHRNYGKTWNVIAALVNLRYAV